MGLFDLFKRSRKSPADALKSPVIRSLPAPPQGPPQAEAPAPALEPGAPQPPTAFELRIMLFDAIATGDEEKLAHICREHHDFLLEYADTWSIVPDALRANAAAARWYGQGFHAIAHFCADKLDRRELLERLESARRVSTGDVELSADARDAHVAA